MNKRHFVYGSHEPPINIVSLDVNPELDFRINVPDVLIYAETSLLALEVNAPRAISLLGRLPAAMKFIVNAVTPADNALYRYPPI